MGMTDFGSAAQSARSRKRWARSAAERFWDRADLSAGPKACWRWLGGSCSGGYGAARSTATGKQTTAHRVAWELTNGPIPDGKQALHRCDHRWCVNPQHLFLGTQLENIRDMIAKGRQANGAELNHPSQVGEKNHGAKLTIAAVRRVKRLAARGLSQAVIAKKVGAERQNVWAIVNGRSWRHVQ